MTLRDTPFYAFTQMARFHFDYLPFQESPDELGPFLLYQAGDLCAHGAYRIGHHVQYCHEVTFIEQGSGQFSVNGRDYPMGKGDIILTRKGDLHDGVSDPANPMRMFYLGFDIVPGADEIGPIFDINALFLHRTDVLAENHPEIGVFFYGIFEELVNRHTYHGQMIEMYIHQLLHSICRIFCGDSPLRYNPAREGDTSGQLVREITTYIDTNIEKIDKIVDITKEMGYSYSHLSHVFKKKMGISMYEYYDKKRFDRATELLQRDDMTVTEIAERLRYQSLHAFSKAFSKHYSVSPSEYAVMYRDRTNYYTSKNGRNMNMLYKKSLPWHSDAAPDFSALRRVLLRHGESPYVPLYELFANPEIIRALMGSDDLGEANWRFYLQAGYDYVPVWPGIKMPLGDLVDTKKPYPVKDWAELKAYPWPTMFSMDQFKAVWRTIPREMRMIGQMGGPFEMAEQLLGYETLCYFLYDEPELMEEMFDKIGSLYCRIYGEMAQEKGVGALVISDDMGYKGGTMISAAHLRKYVKPIHTKLAAIAHQANLPCILHSCGKLDDILDEWIDDVKIDAKHSYEDVIHPVEEMYEKYAPRIAILGGYDLNRLCSDTPEMVYKRCSRLIEMGRAGGYALGSGNSIADFVPADNYLAMLRANKDNR